MLPAALDQLQTQYFSLYSQVEAGEISLDAAIAALERMAVVDGNGAHWSMDLEGLFLRATVAGQPGERTEPHEFADDRIPARRDAPSAPWADQGADLQHASPWDNMPAGVQPLGTRASQQIPTYAEPTTSMRRAKNLGQAPEDGLSPKLNALKQRANSVVMTLARWLPGDQRTAAVILAGVLFVGGLTVYTRMQIDPLDPVGTGVPVIGTDGAPGGLLPVDPEAAVPDAAPVPGAEDGARVVSALTSADRAATISVLIRPGTATTVALQTASLAGVERAGLALVVGPAVDDGSGGMTARFELRDTVDDTPYAAAIVTWISTPDGWKLDTWPMFEATS